MLSPLFQPFLGSPGPCSCAPLPPCTPTPARPFARASAFGPWLADEQRPTTLACACLFCRSLLLAAQAQAGQGGASASGRAAACSPSVEPCLTESLPMSSALARSVERLPAAHQSNPASRNLCL